MIRGCRPCTSRYTIHVTPCNPSNYTMQPIQRPAHTVIGVASTGAATSRSLAASALSRRRRSSLGLGLSAGVAPPASTPGLGGADASLLWGFLWASTALAAGMQANLEAKEVRHVQLVWSFRLRSDTSSFRSFCALSTS